MIQIVYVASPENQKIYVWQLDNISGLLKLIQVICTIGDAQPIAVHPNKQFLYVGVRPNCGITIYRVNSTGLLTYVDTIDILNNSPTYLSCSIDGNFLYCASYKKNTVSVIPINTLSGLLGKPIQVLEGLLGCHSVNMDKNKMLVWIPCLKEHAVRLFKTNVSSGILTPYNPHSIKSNIGSGPRHIIFHDLSCYSYVINELASTVDVIQYNHDQKEAYIIQTLSIIPTNVNTKQYWAADIHITPNKRWLYCSDRATNIISCFKVSKKTKKLEFINYQFTEEQPRGFAIDNQGKFLVVAGQKSNYISLYSIDANNGQLTMLSRHSSGLGPMWVTIVNLSSYINKKQMLYSKNVDI